jgi:hypothetical protein
MDGMSDPVLALLEEFAARRARGERPDPLDYLRRAGDDADGLARQIDRLVQSVPPPPPAAEDVTRMRALVDAEPPLLSLRLAQRVRVRDVVDAVLIALALPAAAADRVRERYHELEVGLLDPARLDGRLRAALAAALGVVEDALPQAPSPPAAEAAGGIAPMGRPRGPVTLGSPYVADGPHGPAALPDPAIEAEVDRLFGVG